MTNQTRMPSRINVAPATNLQSNASHAIQPHNKVNNRPLRSTPADTPRGDIRCPWCETADGQLVDHFTEGIEYMERRAWCSHCGIWRIFAHAKKDTRFPFARNIEAPEQKAELDLAYDALCFATLLDGIEAEEYLDPNGGRGWCTNTLQINKTRQCNGSETAQTEQSNP